MQFHFTVGLKYKIQLTHIKKFLLVAGFIYHCPLAGVLVNGIACSARHMGNEHSSEAGFYSSSVILNYERIRQDLREGSLCCFSSLFCKDLRVRESLA